MANVTVGDRIRGMREERGFSASDLARLTEVTPAAVGNWEKHGRIPRAATLTAICRALGSTEDYIMHGKSNGEAHSPMRRTVDQVLENARNEIADIMGVARSSVNVNMHYDKEW